MKFGIFLQHYFPYGGLQRDAVRLAEAAVQAGDTPVMIVSTWEGPKPAGFQIIELASGGSSNHRKAKRFANDCQSMYQQEQLDTAICFSRVPGTPFHFCGDPCFKEKFTRTKASFNKLLPRYRFLLKNEEELFGSESRTHIFYLAASEIPAYTDFYPLDESRYTLLPPWLKRPKQFDQSKQSLKENLTHELGIKADSKLLLFVGSDFQRKGLDRAIDALAELMDSSTHLVACGKCSPDTYLQQAKQLGIEKQVHILGPRDDIPEWMFISDLLIHPARQETAGMVLLEALTYGLPVLCTENCGYAQAISDAGCTILSKQCSTEEFSHKILHTLNFQPTLKQSIQEWASQSGRYDAARIILQVLTLGLK
jgi:UDP-glucose:(heptosyl)LPS alpha-1,3-glucosyltransferase